MPACCTAHNMILVTGGIACAVCDNGHTRSYDVGCNATTIDDKPCPLVAERAPGLCWIHAIARNESERKGRA